MFERTITFTAAFDKRDSDPNKDVGIGSVQVWFSLRGELGAVVFMLFTNWDLPEVRAEPRYHHMQPGPTLLSIHSLAPLDGAKSPEPCEFLDGRPCYLENSVFGGDPIFARLLREGDAGVWAALEDAYRKQFEAPL